MKALNIGDRVKVKTPHPCGITFGFYAETGRLATVRNLYKCAEGEVIAGIKFDPPPPDQIYPVQYFGFNDEEYKRWLDIYVESLERVGSYQIVGSCQTVADWQPIETAPKGEPKSYAKGPYLLLSCGRVNTETFGQWGWHGNARTGSWKGPHGVIQPTHWAYPPVTP